MSEMDVRSAMPAADPAQAPQNSPGSMLKATRQSQGVHIEALAVALKVPVSKLVALEADNYDALPDAVFVRAFASSVCRSLKMDPAPVLALMPQSAIPRLASDSSGINAVFKDGTEKGHAGALASLAMRPAFLAALALVLGAVGILAFFPHSVQEPWQAGGAIEVAPAAEKVVAAPVAGLAQPASVAVASEGLAQDVAVAPASVPAPAVTAALPTSPVASVTDGMVAVSTEILVFRARSESWIQVRDTTGATTLQRILAAGETLAAPGKPPFTVVVGKADVTDVYVRGKALDLAAMSRDNVARFEVKP